MAYEIVVHELAAAELEELRTFDERRLIAAIEEQLGKQPTQPPLEIVSDWTR